MGLPGIPVGPVTVATSEEELVYSEDADVTLPAHLAHCGWVAVADAVSVGPGAARITTRTMNADELASVRDVPEHTGRLRTLRCAVVAVGNARKRGPIGDWCEAVYLRARNAADLLALRIQRRTDGVPLDGLHEIARNALAPALAEVPDAGATKSDE